jgi:hypothetical protein
MGQPEFVPAPEWDRVEVTEGMPSPPPWVADRPAEVKPTGVQPAGRLFGSIGPDQGYALKLAEDMARRLRLQPGEDLRDVIAGSVGVATKRAALFGRAPVLADVEVGFGAWGFLDDAPEDLVNLRRRWFAQVSHLYSGRRRIADAVPTETLRLTPAEVRARVVSGWRSLLRVDAPAAVDG